ncbi:MAG: prepilin-type N-terminal cleavage/methylation domain-containing protein [Elusimicrobiaceae bacterium]|nr:prepilin-type N-terminal cleavage/methylation domain-containing protein [Elusimicrobiaceae bacterium]
MNQGFTLIELLVVVLIIGVLSAVALPQYQTAVERSRATEALTQMNAVRTALERYHAQHETWPTKFTQLDVEIPEISPSSDTCPNTYQNNSKYYGGKNFCINFTNNVVTAKRLRKEHSYTLTTTITVQEDSGTYSASRSCNGNSDSEAINYCNAITGGKTDF